MEQTLAGIVAGALGGAFVSYGVNKILDQYLRIPLILKVKYLRRKGRAHEYTGKYKIFDYWRDLLGERYGLASGESQVIKAYHLVTFKDVIVTDFVPRAPGFYYSKALWKNPKEAAISLGVVRIIPEEITEPKRLLSIHSPREFEAHADIEKGIPIVVSERVHQLFSEKLSDFGSVHVKKIAAVVSDLGAYSNHLKSADMPSMFPVIRDKRLVQGIGDPVPIMGNAWNIYRTSKRTNLVNFRFWAGVEYHSKSLMDAKIALGKLMPKNGQPLTDFDEKMPHFENAVLRLSEISKYLTRLSR